MRLTELFFYSLRITSICDCEIGYEPLLVTVFLVTSPSISHFNQVTQFIHFVRLSPVLICILLCLDYFYPGTVPKVFSFSFIFSYMLVKNSQPLANQLLRSDILMTLIMKVTAFRDMMFAGSDNVLRKFAASIFKV